MFERLSRWPAWSESTFAEGFIPPSACARSFAGIFFASSRRARGLDELASEAVNHRVQAREDQRAPECDILRGALPQAPVK